MLIGVTGIPGSGKSTFLSFFKEKKIPTFDADNVVKKLYKKKIIINEIKKQFPQFFTKNKFLKNEFSKFIFSSKKNLNKLEKILHPIVIEELKKFKKKNKGKIAVTEIPLLFEKKLEKLFDLTICISCPSKTALKNFSKEKKISIEEAKKRTSFQMPLYLKKKKANIVIKNNGTIDDLKKKFNILLKDIKGKYS